MSEIELDKHDVALIIRSNGQDLFVPQVIIPSESAKSPIAEQPRYIQFLLAVTNKMNQDQSFVEDMLTYARDELPYAQNQRQYH